MTDPRLNQSLRRRCLSATDIVKLRGHYGSPLQVWARKVKGIEPTFTPQQKMRMMVGCLFEAPIFEWYQDVYNTRDLYSFSPVTMDHSNGWLCATPDYLVRLEPGRWRLVEVKTRSTRATEPPLPWVDQVTIQWAVASDWLKARGLGKVDTHMHVAACHMQWGPDMQVWPIDLNSIHLAQLLTFAEDWWRKHIRDGEKPPPGPSRDDTDALGLLHPGGDSGQYRVAPEWVVEAWERDAEITASLIPLEQERNEIRNRVRDYIGEADGLVKPGDGEHRDTIYSWRKNKNGNRYLRRHGS